MSQRSRKSDFLTRLQDCFLVVNEDKGENAGEKAKMASSCDKAAIHIEASKTITTKKNKSKEVKITISESSPQVAGSNLLNTEKRTSQLSEKSCSITQTTNNNNHNQSCPSVSNNPEFGTETCIKLEKIYEEIEISPADVNLQITTEIDIKSEKVWENIQTIFADANAQIATDTCIKSEKICDDIQTTPAHTSPQVARATCTKSKPTCENITTMCVSTNPQIAAESCIQSEKVFDSIQTTVADTNYQTGVETCIDLNQTCKNIQTALAYTNPQVGAQPCSKSKRKNIQTTNADFNSQIIPKTCIQSEKDCENIQTTSADSSLQISDKTSTKIRKILEEIRLTLSHFNPQLVAGTSVKSKQKRKNIPTTSADSSLQAADETCILPEKISESIQTTLADPYLQLAAETSIESKRKRKGIQTTSADSNPQNATKTCLQSEKRFEGIQTTPADPKPQLAAETSTKSKRKRKSTQATSADSNHQNGTETCIPPEKIFESIQTTLVRDPTNIEGAVSKNGQTTPRSISRTTKIIKKNIETPTKTPKNVPRTTEIAQLEGEADDDVIIKNEPTPEVITIEDDFELPKVEVARIETSSGASRHPFQVLLDNITYTKGQFETTKYSLPRPVHYDMEKYIEIKTRAGLNELEMKLRNVTEVAVDMVWDEGNFLPRVLAILFSTPSDDVFVDVVTSGVASLNEIFIDKNIVKVFYRAAPILEKLQLLSLYPVNIFDLETASVSLRQNLEPLSTALKNRFVENYRIEDKGDSKLRPLDPKTALYCKTQTHYILYMYHETKNKLLRISDVMYKKVLHDCNDLCRKIYQWDDHHQVKILDGVTELKKIHETQLLVLERLAKWRIGVAKKRDVNPNSVMTLATITAIALETPFGENEIDIYLNAEPALAEVEELKKILAETKRDLVLKNELLRERERVKGNRSVVEMEEEPSQDQPEVVAKPQLPVKPKQEAVKPQVPIAEPVTQSVDPVGVLSYNSSVKRVEINGDSEPSNIYSGVPTPQFKANLAKIVTKITTKGGLEPPGVDNCNGVEGQSNFVSKAKRVAPSTTQDPQTNFVLEDIPLPASPICDFSATPSYHSNFFPNLDSQWVPPPPPPDPFMQGQQPNFLPNHPSAASPDVYNYNVLQGQQVNYLPNPYSTIPSNLAPPVDRNSYNPMQPQQTNFSLSLNQAPPPSSVVKVTPILNQQHQCGPEIVDVAQNLGAFLPQASTSGLDQTQLSKPVKLTLERLDQLIVELKSINQQSSSSNEAPNSSRWDIKPQKEASLLDQYVQRFEQENLRSPVTTSTTPTVTESGPPKAKPAINKYIASIKKDIIKLRAEAEERRSAKRKAEREDSRERKSRQHDSEHSSRSLSSSSRLHRRDKYNVSPTSKNDASPTFDDGRDPETGLWQDPADFDFGRINNRINKLEEKHVSRHESKSRHRRRH